MTATKDGGQGGSAATNRLYPTPAGYLTARNDKARANLRAFAADHPDEPDWYAEIAAYLGLDAEPGPTPPCAEPGGSMLQADPRKRRPDGRRRYAPKGRAA